MPPCVPAFPSNSEATEGLLDGSMELVCPHCHGQFDRAREGWRCAGCSASFRGLRGIPDLRTSDDEYLANEADWDVALRLNEEFDRLNFRGLLDRYFDVAEAGATPPDLRQRQIDHILTAPERARGWRDALGEPALAETLLDLGCGSGSFLAAVGPSLRSGWGIDIAMRWLIVARKRLDEEGLGHVPLVCACAEKLPFRSQFFTGVVAGDVVEHVADPLALLNESYRVLRPGGRLFLASPNRFSLAPEPHVGVWGVGFLPRRWMARYVAWARGVPFRAIRTLGSSEWRRLLKQSRFGGGTLRAASLPEADLERFSPPKRRLARLYNRLVGSVAGQWLCSAVGPLFHVICRRPEEPARAAIRATRRHSRPPEARR